MPLALLNSGKFFMPKTQEIEREFFQPFTCVTLFAFTSPNCPLGVRKDATFAFFTKKQEIHRVSGILPTLTTARPFYKR